MVDSARRLDAKENHKVVVKEKGKLEQKYMSLMRLTEPLWAKSSESLVSSTSATGDRAATNSTLTTTQIQPTTLV